jgi:monoamine oxidase
LAAARELEGDGAAVTVVEARDRVGGRVHTIRHGFSADQHAEAGADLIEAGQQHVRELASSLKLETTRILRSGWGFYGEGRTGRRRAADAPDAFERAAAQLEREIHDYQLAGRSWNSAVAGALDRSLAGAMRGLRGFYLADPEDLSLLALVDQFASGSTPGEGQMFRIRGGNDQLPRAMAAALRGEILLNSIVRRIHQRAEEVTVGIEHRGSHQEVHAAFCVVALPATTLRAVRFEPELEPDQRRAIDRLQYGPATRVLLQFAKPFWRARGRKRAFGTDLPTGAVWDGSEDQRGPAAILSLLGGGRASRALQEIITSEGEGGVVRRLSWLGRPVPLLATYMVAWESDEWARGGYAVLGPDFDPSWRAWLSRPAGRVLFAGEHTSEQWQGYMNGAIESGRRAAAEVRALVRESRR